jgi:hypothetical protein
MPISSLLPAALSAWIPRRATRAVRIGKTRLPPRSAYSSTDALPRGMVAVASETQAALAAMRSFAHSRSVALQIAADPDLIARVDPTEYQTCLRGLIRGAISRASSGVLVTALRQADSLEVTVLDDGTDPADTRIDSGAQPEPMTPVPHGGSLTADYRPEQGTTIVLRLPLTELLQPWTRAPLDGPLDGNAANQTAASPSP